MVVLKVQSVDLLPEVGDLLRRASWQARSACRGQDMKWFFPDGTGTSRQAVRICSGCPVSAECLSFALADPSLKGVWAGTSERGRMRMRIAMRKSAGATPDRCHSGGLRLRWAGSHRSPARWRPRRRRPRPVYDLRFDSRQGDRRRCGRRDRHCGRTGGRRRCLLPRSLDGRR